MDPIGYLLIAWVLFITGIGAICLGLVLEWEERNPYARYQRR
jgi:hypothetical protein